jgi:hypothetical protein
MLKRHVKLEYYLCKHHEADASKERDQACIFNADGELSLIQYRFCLSLVTLAEPVSHSTYDLVNDLLHIFLACESLLINQLKKLFIDNIVFDCKICPNEFPNNSKSSFKLFPAYF